MLRRLKQRFGISAPKVTVRTHVPWYWRWLALSIMGAVVIGFAWAAYDIGGKLAGFDRGQARQEISRLAAENAGLGGDLAIARNDLVKYERQLEIERATHEDLTRQIRVLTDENAELKEDLAFFQTLMPASSKVGGVSVNRFKLLPDAMPGEYRYRLLLLQASQRAAEFHGRLQLLVMYEQDGNAQTLLLPGDSEQSDAPPYRLHFKFYQRVEGGFRVAPEAVIKSVQVRVFQDGVTAPKLSSSFNL
ncbi:MAG: DUF6776 family protein [Pseudomonadota bacterium]